MFPAPLKSLHFALGHSTLLPRETEFQHPNLKKKKWPWSWGFSMILFSSLLKIFKFRIRKPIQIDAFFNGS